MMKDTREAMARALRILADMLDPGEVEFMRASARRLGDARTQADRMKRENDALGRELARAINERGVQRERANMAERETAEIHAILSRISGEVEKWRDMSARATEEEYNRLRGGGGAGTVEFGKGTFGGGGV